MTNTLLKQQSQTAWEMQPRRSRLRTMLSALLGALLVIVLLVLAMTACQPIARQPMGMGAGAQRGPMTAANHQDLATVDEAGNTTFRHNALRALLSNLPKGDLNDAERESILFMREEEQLAYDVYATLGKQWTLPIFLNIANSEQTHTDAVKMLIERYELSDPTVGKEPGVYTNQTLQDLYNQLMATADQSLAAALRAGAVIEEVDILDLEQRLPQVDNADIQQVYEHLLMGSRNHLRAFTATLQRQTGQPYQPQYLTQEAYDAIVNAPMERGVPGSSGKP